MASPSYLSWINLVLVIIIIIVIIILTVVFSSHRTELEQYALAYQIQTSSSTATTDTMTLSGNQMYIDQSSSALTLTLNTGSNHLKGRYVFIYNNSGNDITLKSGTAMVSEGQLNMTVTKGEEAKLVSVDTKNTWLRVR